MESGSVWTQQRLDRLPFVHRAITCRDVLQRQCEIEHFSGIDPSTQNAVDEILGAFTRAYPDVVLDVTTTNETRLDLVAGHFDAGIHLGEFIERDMIAVRVSGDQRAAIVGAPEYFKAHPRPTSPRDLTNHRCLNFRHNADEIYRWEFDKGRQSLAVGVEGPLVVDDAQLLICAAIDGVGLTFLMEEHAAPYLANGQLVRVLEDWCEPFPGYFLYYPSRRQQPAALSAVIETLRL
jgi:DNA-binding transcriptional LysR family regulator